MARLTRILRQPIEAAQSGEASWRSGYAEDCKSLHPGSIPGEASSLLNLPDNLVFSLIFFAGVSPWNAI
jgi:hypothetical protein